MQMASLPQSGTPSLKHQVGTPGPSNGPLRILVKSKIGHSPDNWGRGGLVLGRKEGLRGGVCMWGGGGGGGGGEVERRGHTLRK